MTVNLEEASLGKHNVGLTDVVYQRLQDYQSFLFRRQGYETKLRPLASALISEILDQKLEKARQGVKAPMKAEGGSDAET